MKLVYEQETDYVSIRRYDFDALNALCERVYHDRVSEHTATLEKDDFCSCCREQIPPGTYKPAGQKPMFCPYCGARIVNRK